ncbi:MAG: hypothetical protein HRT57_08945 [Crocinitomicaceae bacterium]|nr:hypothetical protein [Crocinitomicaceae bacterium]
MRFIVLFSILSLMFTACTTGNKEETSKSKEVTSYYDSGEVRAISSIDNDSLVHGLVKLYYKNENLHSKYQFVHGKKYGDFESYYESGNLKSKGNYKNDLKSGKFSYFYDTSLEEIRKTECFVGGKENGTYHFYREDGSVSSFGYVEDDTTKFYTHFNENGKRGDFFSEKAVLLEKLIISPQEEFSIDFKVYGDESKREDIKYLLVNFDTDDTIVKSVVKNYQFNDNRKLEFDGLLEGKYFIDFYVPMLDTMFIMGNGIDVK